MRIVQLDQAFQRQSSTDAVRRSHFDLFRRHPVAFRLRTTRLQVEPHPGNFSIKTVFSGAERYEFADRVTTVTAGQVLFVKPDVIYSSSIQSSAPTDTFSIFLPKALVGRLLGNRDIDAFLNSALACTSLPGLPSVSRRLLQVATALAEGNELAASEAMVDLVAESGSTLDEIESASKRLKASNQRTKAELMRRLLLCRTLLHDHIEDGVSLSRLAEETCMSEFHLMRCFRQSFGMSVAQYLLRLRMQRAAKLLDAGDVPVRLVAARCGYSDLSAFGRAFRRHWGRSATERRTQPAD